MAEPTTETGRSTAADDWRTGHRDVDRKELKRRILAVEAEARELDAMGLAVAMNTAQVDPREIQLGHDLLPVAERVAKAYNSARREAAHNDLALSRAEQANGG